jgi:hypothetical protein
VQPSLLPLAHAAFTVETRCTCALHMQDVGATLLAGQPSPPLSDSESERIAWLSDGRAVAVAHRFT